MNVNNVDVACISETCLCDEVPSEAVSGNDYNLFRNDHNRRGGGVTCRGVFIPTPFIVFFARNARIGGRSLWGRMGKTVFWP